MNKVVKNNEKHVQGSILHQEECASAERLGPDHGTHHDQRTADAIFHTALGHSRQLGHRTGAGLRTEQHGRPNQRKAGQYPISHREMLQQALLRAGLRYSGDGQRDVFRRQSQAGDRGRLLQAAQRRFQTHGRRQPQQDHIL